MYKAFIFFLISILSFTVISCKNENKKNDRGGAVTEVSMDSVQDNTPKRPKFSLADHKASQVAAALVMIPDTKEFARYCVTAGFVDVLSNENEYFIVFAPSNAAFQALPAEKKKMYSDQKNRAKLANLLRSHIVPGQGANKESFLSLENIEQKDLRTLMGKSITISKEGGEIYVSDNNGNKARVHPDGTQASNGVVYIIDGVLNVD